VVVKVQSGLITSIAIEIQKLSISAVIPRWANITATMEEILVSFATIPIPLEIQTIDSIDRKIWDLMESEEVFNSNTKELGVQYVMILSTIMLPRSSADLWALNIRMPRISNNSQENTAIQESSTG